MFENQDLGFGESVAWTIVYRGQPAELLVSNQGLITCIAAFRCYTLAIRGSSPALLRFGRTAVLGNVKRPNLLVDRLYRGHFPPKSETRRCAAGPRADCDLPFLSLVPEGELERVCACVRYMHDDLGFDLPKP